MELILAPESAPFTGAIIFVILLAISLLVGAKGLFLHLHIHLPTLHLDGLGWLHLGKVPLLVLLVLFLTAFAMIGLTCNAVAHSFLGHYPPLFLSSTIAFLSALLAVHVLGSVLAKIIPSDESSAVSLDSLVGHVAVIINGTAKKNYPAQARVTNTHGQTLYIHVEPESETEQFVKNDSVLLVKQISGTRFLVCANPHPELL